ncbi:MAG: outer membrane beta-barrel protein [Gemmatimonadota bacterium]
MTCSRAAMLCLTALLAVPASLSAQDDDRPPAEHRGVWLSGGLGGGSTSEDDDGPAAYFRIGGSVSQHVLLGGEIAGLTYDVNNTNVNFANATFTLIYDPSLPGGFFTKVGVGIASVRTSVAIGGGEFTTDDEGFGVTLGVGYDIRIGRNLYLTPNLDLLLQGYDDDREASLVLFTLGLGMY